MPAGHHCLYTVVDAFSANQLTTMTDRESTGYLATFIFQNSRFTYQNECIISMVCVHICLVPPPHSAPISVECAVYGVYI